MVKLPDNIKNISATEIGQKLVKQELCPLDLVYYYFDKIDNFDSLSPYTKVFKKESIKQAEFSKQRIKDEKTLSLLDGVPIAWKDLFDISGYRTSGGSKLLENSPVALKDSEVVTKTKNQGLIAIGKTKTVEFALGGLGTNKHFGTPTNAIMEDEPRVPGGSSSGSATAVARDMCSIAIGTDTGGSVRVPAAWNKLYGLKTSYGKISTKGVLPLSLSLDTVGPIGRSIEDLKVLYKILSDEKEPNQPEYLKSKVLIARGLPFSELDPEVDNFLEDSISKLSNSGLKIEEAIISEIEDMYKLINELGAIVTYEAWHQWKKLIKNNEKHLDENVLYRMQIGEKTSEKEAEKIKSELTFLSKKLYSRLQDYDAMIMPTVPILPPKISDVENNQKTYNKKNLLALRNTRIGNELPMCAVTIPGKNYSMPLGLMVYKTKGKDYSLLKIAKKFDIIINGQG